MLNVYERLKNKIIEGSTELDQEEREFAANAIIDDHTERVTKWNDESLLQELSDRGLVV